MVLPKNILRERFCQALQSVFGINGERADGSVNAASNSKFGDYQCNVAFSLSRELKLTPFTIAEKLAHAVHVTDLCLPPTVASPGFINLTLRREYVESQLSAMAVDSRIGVCPSEPSKTVIVDFSSPNVAKEMHVGHLRSTIIGDSIARLMEFRGNRVLRINHVGDWGTQFGMLISYLRDECPSALTTASVLNLGELVTLYRKAKAKFDTDAQFQENARQEVVKLQAGEPETLLAWQALTEQSRQSFEEIYSILDICITERGESFYNAFLPAVIRDLDEKGLLTRQDGAQVVFVPGFKNRNGEPQALLVQKSDGGYNYDTTDLAALRYRITQDKAQSIIYVTDAGQEYHFKLVFAVAQMAGWVPESVSLAHVAFGLVLGEDGKRLRTRSGDSVQLIDLLREGIARARHDLDQRLGDESKTKSEDVKALISQAIGISAIKYADLSQNRGTDYVFSFDKMLSLHGNTAPYLLYVYARIQGILRRSGGHMYRPYVSMIFSLATDSELAVGKHLLAFSEAIDIFEAEFAPSRLCTYLFELGQKFNQFYEKVQIISDEPIVQEARVNLCWLTGRVLECGLTILGISVLDEM